ncbi:MAG: YicC/YloC family endoribonuclease [Christensenellaceae bacterium]|jgi:uncharacterized protein (TIGR00255 family)
MNSMTGFGRGQAEEKNHQFTIEMKSVNHRYLDINIRAPRFLLYLEETIRGEIKQYLTRGRVDVFVNYQEVGEVTRELALNLEMAKRYQEAAVTLEAALNIRNDLSATQLMRMEGVMAADEPEKDEDEMKEVLLRALQRAIEMIVSARGAEGARMAEDLYARGENLAVLLKEIEAREPLVVQEYREKLQTKLEEYLENTQIDENRFQAEILYFADKASITEEIVRIKSHLEELKSILAKDIATGRSFDFLVQELNREFNTIGSKASDITITKAVLDAKGELEKIREQVQNIE